MTTLMEYQAAIKALRQAHGEVLWAAKNQPEALGMARENRRWAQIHADECATLTGQPSVSWRDF